MALTFQLFDIDRVEVLKGPQGHYTDEIRRVVRSNLLPQNLLKS